MTDERMDQWIGVVLRGGVVLAGMLVLAGAIWELTVNGGAIPDYGHFVGAPAELRGLFGVVHSISSGNAAALIQLGILVLIATPAARVLLSVFAFALRKDRLYTAITLFVLAILCAGMAGFRF